MKEKIESRPIHILETGGTKPSFKTKPKRKGIIRSVPLYKTDHLQSESETDSLSVHAK